MKSTTVTSRKLLGVSFAVVSEKILRNFEYVSASFKECMK